MKLIDFETPLILLIMIFSALLVAHLMEAYMNRPGAKDIYTIKDKKGKKLRFEVLRSATDEERRRIFVEKSKEFDAMPGQDDGGVSQSHAK